MRYDQTIAMEYGTGARRFLAGDTSDVYRGGFRLQLPHMSQRVGDLVTVVLADNDPDRRDWPDMSELKPLKFIAVLDGVFGETDVIIEEYDDA